MKQSAKVLILLFVSFLVRPTFTSNADGADCLVECMQRSQMISGMTYDHKYELCQIQCKGQNAPPSYGAIAYSRSDQRWGVAYGQSERPRPKISPSVLRQTGRRQVFDRSQLPQHLRRHRGGRRFGHLGNVRHEAERGGPCGRGMHQTWRQKLRGPSVDLLISGRDGGSLAPQRAGQPSARLLGRHRLQHRGYGRGMVAGQRRSGQRGKGSDGRLCATRQGVRVADHFQ